VEREWIGAHAKCKPHCARTGAASTKLVSHPEHLEPGLRRVELAHLSAYGPTLEERRATRVCERRADERGGCFGLFAAPPGRDTRCDIVRSSTVCREAPFASLAAVSIN
jgi:hypothetical protein